MCFLLVAHAAAPPLSDLLLQIGNHLLPGGKLPLTCEELQREAHLHVEDVGGNHVEGQAHKGHGRVVDVDAVLPQWLHEVVYHLDTHIGAEAGECVLVAGAEHHVVKALRAAVREDGSILCEAFHIRLLRYVAHECCVRGRGKVVA